jgi:hypothetical protein
MIYLSGPDDCYSINVSCTLNRYLMFLPQDTTQHPLVNYIYIIVDVIYLRAILNKIPYCNQNLIKSRKALKIHTRKYINIHIQQCITP